MPLGDLAGVRFGDTVEALGRPLPVTRRRGAFSVGSSTVWVDPSTTGLPCRTPRRWASNRRLPTRCGGNWSIANWPSASRPSTPWSPAAGASGSGIFAGSGVGKSSLLSMVARGTDAAVSVVALVGERGREVNEFIQRDLGPRVWPVRW